MEPNNIWLILVILVHIVKKEIKATYVGCYQESFPRRLFGVSPGNYEPLDLNPQQCVISCMTWRHQFAALSSGKFCFCGDVLPAAIFAANDGFCSEPCSDTTSTSTCGSHTHVSVYKTAVGITGLKVKTVGSNIVETGSPVSLEYNVRSGPSPLEFWANYGDGAGQTSRNATPMDVQTYSVPGEYLVTIFAQDKDGLSETQSYSVPVLAQSPIDHAEIQCPMDVGTLEEFQCAANVLSGSFIKIQTDFGNGQTGEKFPIFDPKWHTAGQGIPQHDKFPDNTSLSNKVCLMPDSEFQFPGTLLGWEFYANATGNVVFLVLEPTCSVNAYCHKTNDCPATCSPANEWTCSGANSMFCPMHGVCTDAALTANCSGTNRYASLPTGYKVIGNFPHTITVSGHNYFAVDLATNRVEVKPGDVIGVVQIAGMLGLRSKLTGEEQDRYHASLTGDQAVRVTFTKTDFLLTSHKLLVRAVASRATTVLAFHTYANEGTFTVSLNLSNTYTPSFKILTAQIRAHVSINATIIDCAPYGATDKPVMFEVWNHTGVNVTYVWHFGDGTNLTTTEQSITHTYIVKGSYDVNVTATNRVSSRSNVTSITIQEELSGMNITYNTTTSLYILTKYTFTLQSGSDYMCNWNFDDSSLDLTTNEVSTPVGSDTTRTHNFTTTGTFTVNVTCWNKISKQSMLFTQILGSAIRNLQVSPKGAAKNVDFNITFTYEEGTNPKFKLTFNKIIRQVTVDETTKSGQTYQVIGQMLFGSYPLILRGFNQGSEETIMLNFTIDNSIEGHSSKVSPQSGRIGDVFVFNVTLQKGSSVIVIWEFGDGTNQTYSLGDAVNWTPSATQSVSHTYSMGGTYKTAVTIKNYADTYVLGQTISVYNNITNLTLASNAPVPYIDGSGIVNFYFTTDGDPPVLAQVEFVNYSDGLTGRRLMNFTLGQVYPHIYFNKGSYEAVANISNLISSALCKLRVSIDVPITNMQLYVTPSHAPIGQPVSVGVAMDTGTNVTLTFDFGDNSSLVVTPRHDENPWVIQTERHSYTTCSTSGYTITVTGTNPLGEVIKTYALFAQFVVTRQFCLNSTAPTEFQGIPRTVNFTLSFPVTGQLPSNATLAWLWGDGTQEAPVPLPLTSAPSVLTNFATHAYSAAGDHIASVIIGNKVNQEEFKVSAGMYERITGATVRPMFQPNMPASAGHGPGLGPHNTEFPHNRPVYFYVNATSDVAPSHSATVTLFEVTVISNSSSEISHFYRTSNPIDVFFNTSGPHLVSIVASNSLPSEAEVNVSLSIRISPTKPVITVDKIKTDVLKKSQNLNVSFDTINTTDTCVKIEFGDGSMKLFDGESNKCMTFFDRAADAALNRTLSIKHTYQKEGQYVAKLIATSNFGSDSTSEEIIVYNLPCPPPKVSFEQAEIQFTNASEQYRNTNLDLRCIVKFNCSTGINRWWKIESIDEVSGKALQMVDLKAIKSITDNQLYIPARFLPLGLYKFTFTVTMTTSGAGFVSAAAVTYMRIVPSPLVARLVEGGMTSIMRGLGRTINLNAATFSRDPDMDSNIYQGFTNFEWYCRKSTEQFEPRDADGKYSGLVASSPKSAEEIQAGVPDNGGCFRRGAGRVNNTGNPSLIFNTNNMHVNNTYVFEVFVFKNKRVAKAVLNLIIVDGNPPDLVMSCRNNLCQPQPDGWMLNPSALVSVGAACREGCLPDLTYTWSGYRAGLGGHFIEIPNFRNYINDFHLNEIAIDPRLFTDGFNLFTNMTVYKLQVSAQSPGGTAGTVYTKITVNKPPGGGNCSVSPLHGKADTIWNAKCTGWTDDNGIESYRFHSIPAGHVQETVKHRVLSLGPKPLASLAVPVTLMSNTSSNTSEELYCRIYDTMGAYTEYHIATLSFELPPIGYVNRLVLDLVNNPNNILAVELTRGNLGTANIEALKVAAMLNTAQASSLPAASKSPDQNGVQITNWTLVQQMNGWSDVKLQQQKADYDLQRSLRSLVREKIVTTLPLTPGMTISDMHLIASTIAVTTSVPNEISRNSQIAISKAIPNFAARLEALENDISYADILDFTSTVIELSGNVGKAMVMSAEDPSINEFKQSRESLVFEYESNLESDRQRLDYVDPESRSYVLNVETNLIIQKDAVDKWGAAVISAVGRVGRVLARVMVPGQEPVKLREGNMALTVQKAEANQLTQRYLSLGRGQVRFPPFCSMARQASCSNKQTIALVATEIPFNVFAANPRPHEPKKVYMNSAILNLELVRSNGDLLPIKGIKHDIELLVPRPSYTKPAVLVNVTANFTGDLFYHSFNVSSANASIHLEIRPHREAIQLLVVIKHNGFPTLNGSDAGWDWVGSAPSSMAQARRYAKLDAKKKSEYPDPWIIVLDTSIVANRMGKWIVGIRQNSDAEKDKYNIDSPPPVPKPGTGQPECSYSFGMFTSGCYYRDGTSWSSKGVFVSKLTTRLQTQCFTNHLSSFGSGWVVEPNTIDFAFVFANADFSKNQTLYTTEIVIALVYLLCAVWARRKDRKDTVKLGVTPLADNDPNDVYYYEVTVQTGRRKNAGTDSKVHMILSGEYDETDVRVLEDSQRKVLRRGETDTFLVSVPRPLGPLSYARIWHDNSGKGKFAGWYCNYIIIRDLQTNTRSYFIINRWFAVEEDDGQVDRLMPVASAEDMEEFGHLFAQTATRNLADEHIWFSVVARPPQSRFTRVQRVSCCLLLLFSSMLANAMFYEKAADGAGKNTITIGPFALSPEQIFIGVVANFIVFPVNFLCAFLFRKSRPRRLRTNRINDAMGKSRRGASPSAGGHLSLDVTSPRADLHPIMEVDDGGTLAPIPDTAQLTQPLRPMEQQRQRPWSPNKNRVHPEEGSTAIKKKQFSLPWYCEIISWMILWISVGVSFAFVTFYGIDFGDLKAKQWISSMVISFVTSVFLTQPIKVFLLAILFSLIFKKADIDDADIEEDEEHLQVKCDEEHLHPLPGEEGYVLRERKVAYCPPNSTSLDEAREKRRRELQMFDVLREILFYALFIWILMVVSYGFRDPNAFLLKRNIKRSLTVGETGRVSNSSNNFLKARTMEHFFNWSRDTLSAALRADIWYNGAPPYGQRGFTSDRANRLMGYAIMRQLRMPSTSCARLQFLNPSCQVPYNMLGEDKDEYGVGWIKATRDASGAVNNSKYEYKYRTASELEGWPFWAGHELYSGGGYVVAMNGSLRTLKARIDEIEADEWIDRNTKAVFIEFTVYNPASNLFGIVTLGAEFLVTGGLHPYLRVEAMNLLGFMSGAQGFQIVCQVLFVLFLVFFIVKEIRKINKQRNDYFKDPWSYIEWAVITLSVGGIVIYFYRLMLALEKVKYFKHTHGNSYMKFQLVGYWNELLLYMIGWICFFACVKFIRLLRFNKKMSLLSQTLRHAAKPLIMFSVSFGILFFAFSQFFYLIYFMDLLNFSQFIFAAETCIQMLVGKFNFKGMVFSSPILGPVIFFGYVVTVYYILLNMFVTILNESFATVRSDPSMQSNEFEVVDYMVNRFMAWTGLGSLMKRGKRKVERPIEKPSAEHVDTFSKKVDELLFSITHAYLSRDVLEDVFFSRKSDKDVLRKMMQGRKMPHQPPGPGDPNSKGSPVGGLPHGDINWQ